MTITWADLLADIRVDLKDASGTKWSDANLFVWFKDALRDFTNYSPKRVDAEELTATDSTLLVYTLPTGFIDDIYVQSPEGIYLEKQSQRPGSRFYSTARPYYYRIENGQLTLSAAPISGNPVLLTYYCMHDLPTSEADLAAVMSFEDSDVELIRLYVYAKAHLQLRGNQSRLDRFRETGKRDDNPIIIEFANPMDEYNRKIAERFSGGVIKLYRPGRVR